MRGDNPGSYRVVFDQPQRAIAPGQAVVVYHGDVVLGGGTAVAAEEMQLRQRRGAALVQKTQKGAASENVLAAPLHVAMKRKA